MPTFLIGRMASFKDASGATVTHFERARGFGRSYWQDVTAKSKAAATRAVNRANARAKSKGDKNTSPFFAITCEVYDARQDLYNPQCKTRNMLNPKAGFIDIDAAGFGGCCDPGTERYHCM